MYLVFTCMPGESYLRRLRSLLYLRYAFQALTPLCVDCSNILLSQSIRHHFCWCCMHFSLAYLTTFAIKNTLRHSACFCCCGVWYTDKYRCVAWSESTDHFQDMCACFWPSRCLQVHRVLQSDKAGSLYLQVLGILQGRQARWAWWRTRWQFIAGWNSEPPPHLSFCGDTP